jgi:hypothetical protein
MGGAVIYKHQRLNEQKGKMKNEVLFPYVAFVMLLTAGVNAQVQQQSNRIADRQVSGILQRLEQTSNRFRGSLNLALVNGRIDETRPQNDINTFEPAFSSAIDQFTNRFTHRQAAAAVCRTFAKGIAGHGFASQSLEHRCRMIGQQFEPI